MPEVEANGVRLYYELGGDGEPLALVHGSWMDASAWGLVRPGLERSFRVLAYDRRGHSRSERPEGQGSVDEDGDDLAALLEALDEAPAHVVASSYGSNVALRLAIRRPELFRSLSCQEPPLWSALGDEPAVAEMMSGAAASIEQVTAAIAAGDNERAARRFVDEVIMGPGAWENELPEAIRAVLVQNAPTFGDELRDPEQTEIDLEAVASLEVPVRLTMGTESPQPFHRVVERLGELIPGASVETFEGAGHGPHTTHPEAFVEATVRGIQATRGGG